MLLVFMDLALGLLVGVEGFIDGGITVLKLGFAVFSFTGISSIFR